MDHSCHVFFSMNIPSPFMVFHGGSLLFFCGCVNMKKAADKSINTHENESCMFSHAFGVFPLNFPCFLSFKKMGIREATPEIYGRYPSKLHITGKSYQFAPFLTVITFLGDAEKPYFARMCPMIYDKTVFAVSHNNSPYTYRTFRKRISRHIFFAVLCDVNFTKKGNTDLNTGVRHVAAMPVSTNLFAS